MQQFKSEFTIKEKIKQNGKRNPTKIHDEET